MSNSLNFIAKRNLLIAAILKRFILETREKSRWIWDVKMHLIVFDWPNYVKSIIFIAKTNLLMAAILKRFILETRE